MKDIVLAQNTPVADAAASAPVSAVPSDPAGSASGAVLPPAPSQMDVLLWNVGFIAVLVGLFYLLLIRPQQSRYREHADMLKKLHKGDKVVLQSGMIGIIHEIATDGKEMTIEFEGGVRARVLRSAIAGKYADIVKVGA